MTTQNFSLKQRLALNKQGIIVWLCLMGAMTLCVVGLGSYTRHSTAGLSMVEWKPLTGWLPPLNTDSWQEAFQNYKGTHQFHALWPNMKLEAFQRLYLIEYVHRLSARGLGVLSFIGLLGGVLLGAHKAFLTRTLIIGLVIGAQGTLGWFMVKSGLSHTKVNALFLSAHLLLACLLFWLIINSLLKEIRYRQTTDTLFKGTTGFLLGVIVLQVFMGSLLAGTQGGRLYDTFFMGTEVIDDILQSLPEGLYNIVALNVLHRLLGLLALVLGGVLWWQSHGKKWTSTIGVLLCLQAGIGLLALWFHLPPFLGVCHTIGGVLLIGFIGGIYSIMEVSS